MRIIAGPCQHETLEQSMEIAETCARVCSIYEIEYYFKASYDKANRTSLKGKRGVGLANTMSDFTVMKDEIPGLKILTDVHTNSQVDAITSYTDVVDVLPLKFAFIH